MEIAKAAGISQAYLFRLFPTKAELFMALVERCNARVQQTFADAAAAARAAGEPVLVAMGDGLHRAARRSQPPAQPAATRTPPATTPRSATRCARGFARLVELVEHETGADAEEVRAFFAHGMLLNVLAAMQAQDVDAHWAHVLLKPAAGPRLLMRLSFFARAVSD